MALDLTQLTIYPQQRREIIAKLANKQTVLGYFTSHIGYNPGKTTVRLYEGAADLGPCCDELDDTPVFTEHEVNIVCIASRTSFCHADLAEALNDFNYRFTAGQESIDAELVALFTEGKLAKMSYNVDKLIWLGDVNALKPDGSPDNNLNRLDGLIKLALANVPASQNLTITTAEAANLQQAIELVYDTLPIEAFDAEGDGIDIFTGRNLTRKLQRAYVRQDPNNYNPGNTSPDDTLPLWGSANVRIIPTRGLDGTNYIVATSRGNIHWYTNIEDDYQTLAWDYNSWHKRFFMDIEFLLGLTFGIYEYVVIATVDDAVINAPIFLPVGIVSPLAADGGVQVSGGGATADLTNVLESDPSAGTMTNEKLLEMLKELGFSPASAEPVAEQGKVQSDEKETEKAAAEPVAAKTSKK